MAASHLPWKICRLSSVIGSARQPNYLQSLIRIVPRSPFPMIPANAEARIDLIPSTFAAGALAWLHDQGESQRIYHVTAGRDRSLPVPDIIERVFRLAQRPKPRLGELEEFEAYAKGLSGPAKDLPDVLRPFLPHLTLRQDFLNCRTRSALTGSGLPEPDAEGYFDRFVLDCWSSPA